MFWLVLVTFISGLVFSPTFRSWVLALLQWIYKLIAQSGEQTAQPPEPPGDQRTLAQILAEEERARKTTPTSQKSHAVTRTQPRPQPARDPVAVERRDVPQTATQPRADAPSPIPAPRSAPTPPPSPARSPAKARWIPFGVEAQIGQTTVAGGGFYCGRPTDDLISKCPALIDPALPVSLKTPDWNGDLMGYWPRYEGIDPRSRAAFLGFLHSERNSPGVGTGLVFLYFYGLEFRALVEAQHNPAVAAEIPQIAAEVRRLLDVYGSNGSVRNYLTNFLDILPLLSPQQDERITDPQHITSYWTTGSQVALGRLAAAGALLPADWALQWARILTPEAHSSTWDCVIEEIRALFSGKYTQLYPGGFKTPTGRAKLSIDYRFAAPIFSIRPKFETQLPDVSRITAPLRPVIALLRECLEELRPLRTARRGKNSTPLAELAALPAALWGTRVPAALVPLRDHLGACLSDREVGEVPLSEILALVDIDASQRFGKREATQLGQALDALGIGMEPDVRFLGATPSTTDSVIVFTAGEDPSRSPSPSYSAAFVMIQAAIAVAAAADGISDEEVAVATNGVETHFALTSAERRRLEAHVELLKANPPSLVKTENRVRQLERTDREAFAHVLLDIAAADGRIDPEEVKMIERFYKALGLDETRVHSDLHQASMGHGRDRSGREASTTLDPAAIEAKLAETSRVQAVLSRIFAEEQSAPIDVQSNPDASTESTDDNIGSLDAPHSRLIREALAVEGDEWPRDAFEALCESLGLLPDGALESLNEVAYEFTGEPLVEGEDPIHLNDYARTTLTETLAATTNES